MRLSKTVIFKYWLFYATKFVINIKKCLYLNLFKLSITFNVLYKNNLIIFVCPKIKRKLIYSSCVNKCFVSCGSQIFKKFKIFKLIFSVLFILRYKFIDNLSVLFLILSYTNSIYLEQLSLISVYKKKIFFVFLAWLT